MPNIILDTTSTKKSILTSAAKFNVKSLLSIEADAKTVKGSKQGYLTGIMYLKPDATVCPSSTIAGCLAPCLVSAGRAGIFPAIMSARQNRTELFYNDPATFFSLLVREISALIIRADKLGLIPVVRLNGTSDINWTKYKLNDANIFDLFPDLQFYDYTKQPSIIRQAYQVDNWHITASYSEANDKYTSAIVSAAKLYKANLAAVFSNGLPDRFLNRTVVDGDETDLRFLDSKDSSEPVIVGLKAKGKARQDTGGFVVDASKHKNRISVTSV